MCSTQRPVCHHYCANRVGSFSWIPSNFPAEIIPTTSPGRNCGTSEFRIAAASAEYRRYAVLPDGGDYLLGIQPPVLRLLVQLVPPCDVHAVRQPQRICQLALKHIPPRRIAARNKQLWHSLLRVFRSDRANCVNERSRMMCEIGEHRHATGFAAHFHPPLDAGKTAEAGLNLFPGQAELTGTNCQRRASIGTATSECWRLTRRGGSWWRQMPTGIWGRGVRHPGQIQCAQILALSGQDTRRDICGHSCWRVATGCLRSSAAGAAGGCA